jgi:hypothetical protein
VLADASEDVAQVGLRIQADEPRRSYQTIEDSRVPGTSVGSGKEIVAAADGDRAQGSFGDH